MAIETPRLNIRAEQLRLGDLRLLEVNARYMRHETYQALVDNLRRDGVLTQAPFAVRDEDGKYLVLSGNHRVKAAVEAFGADHVDTVLVTDDPLTKQQRLAIQLSHNSIVGEDDPSTLRALYESLDSIDWRTYSGLDDKALELLAPVQMAPLSEPNLAFQPITLIFLPDEVDKVEAVWDEAKSLAGTAPIWQARMSEYDACLDALDATGKAHGVKNVATAMLLVLDVFQKHMTDLQEGYLKDDEPIHKGWVPVASLLGTYDVPATAAAVIARAISTMIDRSEVSDTARWQSLEHWAADYLAGT